MKTLKVGMLGAGVVGSQIARLLIANKSDLASRAGANLELVSIAVKDSKLKRDGIPAALLTTDAKSIVNDPQIDLVIEVIGGIDPAKELILTALKNGKSVVTANKALLAKHGAELYAAADKANVDLYYEAAVAGAIPILRPLRESLVGDHVIRAERRQKQKRSRAEASKALPNKQREKIFRVVLTKQKNPVYTARLR